MQSISMRGDSETTRDGKMARLPGAQKVWASAFGGDFGALIWNASDFPSVQQSSFEVGAE